LKVSELMSTRVVSVEPGTNVREAAVLMNRNNIGSVPVVENGAVSGMLTDRDIVLRCVAEGKDASTVRVSDICTTGAVSVKPGQPIHDAINLMASEQIRRLPVVDNGRLVGILSLADIAREKSGMELAEALSEISMP
jgi:CBS domain-containing protein